jgi:hypothetical protein
MKNLELVEIFEIIEGGFKALEGGDILPPLEEVGASCSSSLTATA